MHEDTCSENVYWVQRAREGDEEAFYRLVQKYQRSVYTQIRTLISDPQDAEELTNDVFIKAYRHLDSLRDPSCFGAWLRQIARYHVWNWLERRPVPGLSLEEVEGVDAARVAESLTTRDSIEQPLLQKEAYHQVRQAMACLSPEDRTLMEEFYLEDESYETLQARYGLTKGTLGWRLHRARQKVRRRVESLQNGFTVTMERCLKIVSREELQMYNASDVCQITEAEQQQLIQLLSRFQAETEHSGACVKRAVVKTHDISLAGDEPNGLARAYYLLRNEQEEPQLVYEEQDETAQPCGFFDRSGSRLSHEVEIIGDTIMVRVNLPSAVLPGEPMEFFEKAFMGGEEWLKAPHHQRCIQRGQPAILESDTGAGPGSLIIQDFTLPLGCRLYECFEQPREIWTEADRLHLLYVFFGWGSGVQWHKVHAKYLVP